MGADDSAPSAIQESFWILIRLFELDHEPLFSFVKASFFALFLQSVEKRFFTALSVLNEQKRHAF